MTTNFPKGHRIMKFSAKSTTIDKQKTPCAVIFASGKTLLPSAQTIDKSLGGTLSHLVKNEDLKTSAGNSLWIALNPEQSSVCQRLMIVQLGSTAKNTKQVFSQTNLRKAFNQISAKLKAKGLKEACIFVDDITVEESNNKDALTWIGETLAKSTLHTLSLIHI